MDAADYQGTTGVAPVIRGDPLIWGAPLEMQCASKIGLRPLWLAIAIFAVVPAVRAARQSTEDRPSEYQVKAACLFNFLKFVEWPSDAFSDPLAPVVIGIVGDDPFGADLSQIILGKTVMNRDVIVRHYKQTDDLRTCQILFISSSEGKRLPKILEGLRGFSVLTVADLDHFIEAAGMIQFKVEDNRVRFAIGLDSAVSARLKISSKLLAVAQSVATSKQKEN
jgi:hypothetical protein